MPGGRERDDQAARRGRRQAAIAQGIAAGELEELVDGDQGRATRTRTSTRRPSRPARSGPAQGEAATTTRGQTDTEGSDPRAQPRRLALEPRDDREPERGSAGAVDDAVVERDGDRPRASHDDFAVADDRSRRDAADAEDRDLGVVHDRRLEEARELPGARDREGRAPELTRSSVPARAPSARRRISASSSSTVLPSAPRTTGTTRPCSV